MSSLPVCAVRSVELGPCAKVDHAPALAVQFAVCSRQVKAQVAPSVVETTKPVIHLVAHVA
jgi:hypothetical protein